MLLHKTILTNVDPMMETKQCGNNSTFAYAHFKNRERKCQKVPSFIDVQATIKLIFASNKRPGKQHPCLNHSIRLIDKMSSELYEEYEQELIALLGSLSKTINTQIPNCSGGKDLFYLCFSLLDWLFIHLQNKERQLFVEWKRIWTKRLNWFQMYLG